MTGRPARESRAAGTQSINSAVAPTIAGARSFAVALSAPPSCKGERPRDTGRCSSRKEGSRCQSRHRYRVAASAAGGLGLLALLVGGARPVSVPRRCAANGPTTTSRSPAPRTRKCCSIWFAFDTTTRRCFSSSAPSSRSTPSTRSLNASGTFGSGASGTASTGLHVRREADHHLFAACRRQVCHPHADADPPRLPHAADADRLEGRSTSAGDGAARQRPVQRSHRHGSHTGETNRTTNRSPTSPRICTVSRRQGSRASTGR